MKIAKPKSRGSSITELPLFVLLKGEIKMTGSIKNKIMAVIFALLGYCSTLVDGDCIHADNSGADVFCQGEYVL